MRQVTALFSLARKLLAELDAATSAARAPEPAPATA